MIVCPYGHPMDGAYKRPYWYRGKKKFRLVCRICTRLRNQQFRQSHPNYQREWRNNARAQCLATTVSA